MSDFCWSSDINEMFAHMFRSAWYNKYILGNRPRLCSFTFSMASSAASALPAWVNRRRWCLNANGSPTRSYVSSTTTSTTTTGITLPPDNLVNLHEGFLFLLSAAHESHHDPRRTRVPFSARGFQSLTIDQFSDDRRSPIRWIVVV